MKIDVTVCVLELRKPYDAQNAKLHQDEQLKRVIRVLSGLGWLVDAQFRVENVAWNPIALQDYQEPIPRDDPPDEVERAYRQTLHHQRRARARAKRHKESKE
jgi:hypothetical protein